MATINTKYSVGDTVWHANTTPETRQHPCPACLGTRKWAATSPVGNEYTLPCPRCTVNYSAHDELSLKYTAFTAAPCKLTIGSIRHDSKPFSGGSATQYMCVETGVGSGTIYDEDLLFPTEQEATVAATARAAVSNSAMKHIVDRYNRTLDISDYQFENALLKKAADAQREARSLLYNLSDLFVAINEADDKDAILEAVDEYKRWSLERDVEATRLAPPTASGERERG